MANIIDSLKFGSTQGVFTLPYAECGIAAGTVAKTATATNFVLAAGARVAVKFTYANTASNPTLNINSTGAKNIYHKGAQITTGGNKALLAGTVDFIYDGTQYHIIGNYIDTNTDIRNTAGSTDISSKIYLIGATSQAANPQTYSHNTVYVGADGLLYSNDSQVVNLKDTQAITGSKTFDADTKIAAGRALTLKGTTQSSAAHLGWETINSHTPFFGYATNQSDGTFVWSLDGGEYTTGLAISGGTGNLLWKGAKIPTVAHTHNVSHEPAGTVEANTSTTTVAGSAHTHSVTADGTVSQPTFTGTKGTTEAPSATTSVYSITNVGALPTLTSDVTTTAKCMTITFSQGSLPERSSVTVASNAHKHTYTPAGSVSQPTFTGKAVDSKSPSATAAVASSTHAHTFKGTAATLTTGQAS